MALIDVFYSRNPYIRAFHTKDQYDDSPHDLPLCVGVSREVYFGNRTLNVVRPACPALEQRNLRRRSTGLKRQPVACARRE